MCTGSSLLNAHLTTPTISRCFIATPEVIAWLKKLSFIHKPTPEERSEMKHVKLETEAVNLKGLVQKAQDDVCSLEGHPLSTLNL